MILGINGMSTWFSLQNQVCIHLWGLSADWNTLCRRVRVDILRHSAQRVMNEKVVEKGKQS
jgi:hypothetical protein